MVSLIAKSNLVCYFVICFVFLLSFRSYAGYLDPDFNSDMAVHALMAYDLKLPEDLYYWGQDRLGSIVPILGHVLLKLFPLSPVEAISYVQYFFLALGFFCFASLFKTTKSKAIFALIYFLPHASFQELVKVSHPYGPQLAFIGVAFVMVENLEESKFNGVLKQFFLSILVISLILSLWISELSAITIFLLALSALTYFHRELRPISDSKKVKQKKAIIKASLFNVCFLLIAGTFFLVYSKLHASSHLIKIYFKVNTIQQNLEVINKLGKQFLSTFNLGHNFYFALNSILLIILIVYGIFCFIKGDYTENFSVQHKHENKYFFSSRWSLFFCLNAFLGIITIITSNFIYNSTNFLDVDNDASLRYYVPIYVFCWLAVLRKTEKINRSVSQKIYVLLIALALTSSLSLPSYVYKLEKPKSKIHQLEAIQSVGTSSFIGDYWTAYLISATNPKLLTATPHDKHYVRCLRCVPRVLALETIYLVKEGWLDSFPSEITQFGWRLKKVGEAKIMGGYTLAPYKKISISAPSGLSRFMKLSIKTPYIY